MAIISPSLLAADFRFLSKELEKIKQADYIHFDVIDGSFAPNITFGIPIMESLNKGKHLPYDVHLMIDNPQDFIDKFIDSGAEIIHVHFEGNNHINSLINKIKERGAKASVVINPGTPVNFLEEVLQIVDMVLVMTVNPGYTGQKFIKEASEKIEKLNFIREKRNLNFKIAVDGGVNKNNAKDLVNMGADFLIMGAAVFRDENPEEVINYIKGL